MTFFDRFTAPHLIGAHRGFRACRPENTQSAFAASIGRCHFIEIDVQVSRDGIPVVIHDPSLSRTTDALSRMQEIGVNSLRVSSWNIDQLQQLDAGAWFLEADPFTTLAGGQVARSEIEGLPPQRILSLEELLNWALHRKMPVNIEIKHQHKIVFDQHIVSMVLDVIHRTGAAPMVLISSFNHDYLFQCKSLAPHISIGVLQDEQHPPDLVAYLKAIGAAAYHPDDGITTRDMIRTLRSAGIGINVYTVNDRKRQQELFAFGATAVFTDYPELPAA